MKGIAHATDDRIIECFRIYVKGKKLIIKRHKNGVVIIHFEDGGLLGINDRILERLKCVIEV